MIKKIAWDMFEKTGNINTFIAFKNIEEMQKQQNGFGINDDTAKVKNINQILDFKDEQ